MTDVSALIVVKNLTGFEWLAHKTFLEWTLDALKRVTALNDQILIGVMPEIWDVAKGHLRPLVAAGRMIQFPGAHNTEPEELVSDLQGIYPSSKRFIITVPDHPLFPAEKYEAMFAATATAEWVVAGRDLKVRQVLPNGRALRNNGLWEARGVFAHGLGHATTEVIHVDLPAVLDAADPTDRNLINKLVEG